MKTPKELRKEAGNLDAILEVYFREFILNKEDRDETKKQIELILYNMEDCHSPECVNFYKEIYDTVQRHFYDVDFYSFHNN